MARYIQKISLLGKQRWIGWEVDGIGTEIPGLILADDLSDEEIRSRGIKSFEPLPFEHFIGMGAASGGHTGEELLQEDLDFRLDALQVGIERFRSQGVTDIPRTLLDDVFGGAACVEDPRVQMRLREWAATGAVELVGQPACYLRIKGRLA